MVIKHNGNASMEIWKYDNFLEYTGETKTKRYHYTLIGMVNTKI